MKNIPSWVWAVFVLTFFSLLFSPFVGIILLVLFLIYLKNHHYFDQTNIKQPRKPDTIPNQRVNRSTKSGTPPQFIRKIEFLSNREIAFSNFTSVRYLEENGSHQMIDVRNPRNAKIYIRLNTNQFDVFIDCNGSREQLSFEKSNLKIMDITNHGISMIEGNQDDSYLKIGYNNQFFTTLEVEALLDFFKDFSIHNKTTKFQEQPIYEDVQPIVEEVKKTPKQPKQKKSHARAFKGALIGGFVSLALFICGFQITRAFTPEVKIDHQSILGPRKNTKYYNGLSYEVNNEVTEYDWGSYQIRYTFSKKWVPIVMINNQLSDTDYTEIYDYSQNSFEAMENELELYEYKYYGEKKQYDFVNLNNGKWYHFSGIVPKDHISSNDSKKDVFVDIYVMPTSKSLVQVTLIRAIDDMCDYDIIEFINGFDLSELMTFNL